MFKRHPRCGWKPGRFSLTRDHLRFTQSHGQAWHVPVGRIVRTRCEPLPVVLRRQETIRLFHKAGSGHVISSIWMVTRDTGPWLRRFAACCFRDPEEISAIILKHLSRQAAAVLQCVCERRQTSVQEVVWHTGARDADEVLRLVHREINPVASREIGFPLLALQPEGKQGPGMSWLISFEWPERENICVEDPEDFECDVFDEADRYCVVAVLPGVDEGSTVVEALEDCLLISAVAGSRVYRKKISWPSREVDPQSLQTSLHNHVLEIRFRKRINRANRCS